LKALAASDLTAKPVVSPGCGFVGERSRRSGKWVNRLIQNEPLEKLVQTKTLGPYYYFFFTFPHLKRFKRFKWIKRFRGLEGKSGGEEQWE
jgi:hypothetical protein